MYFRKHTSFGVQYNKGFPCDFPVLRDGRSPRGSWECVSLSTINNTNSLFDPIMKNTIRNTILENKLRYRHAKKPSGLV